ncbi:WAT1-related protein At1g68170-like isoform X2 [Primulina eburnea]|uniref:WAT1-related protein At1g68170-like isoform X2 n=1 Tax=Primulina eburnea TaxID=1245227 RepID=UPI003C6C5F18
MWRLCDSMHGLKPTIMMVAVQVALTGVNVFYKLAANNRMSMRVLVAYRLIFAAATVVPIALIVERKKRPKLTRKIAFQTFISALFGGSMAQNLYAESLALTTVTFAAAMSNLIPAVTFVLAILFRMEKLGLKTMAGKAKVMGTFLSIGGAMLLTFFKGLEVKIWSIHVHFLQKNKHADGHIVVANQKSINNVIGLLLALACCFSYSFSLIIQAKVSEKYPCHYSSTALISVMGSIQAVVYALCTERDWSQWKLGWDLKLLTVAYMGIIGSGLMWVLLMSCLRMRGPLFVSVFNPLLLVLVALSCSIFLDEKLYLGSVLGTGIIICGLYCVLWGKSKEIKKVCRLVPSSEDQSLKGDHNVIHGGCGIMAMAPNFVSDTEITQVLFGKEDEPDLEAKISEPQTIVPKENA